MTKDVVVVEMGCKRVPKKIKKVELEKDGKVISGFDVNRTWDATQLHNELASLLCGETNEADFEIVKKSSGTLLKPNIPNGKKIDAKLLLKSIAPSGSIYLRLLYKNDPSASDSSDECLQVSLFLSTNNSDATTFQTAV